jgi:hypothetical protein
MSTMRSVRLSAAAAAVLLATACTQSNDSAPGAPSNDSIRGAPSEANHFIETPRGWVHPMTPWGEPDIRATLNMMQAAGVPLERCANSYRYGAPACDMNKKWLTEEEYNERVEALATRVDRSNQLREQGDIGGALQAGLTDPNIPQRQTNLIVDPPDGLLPELTPEAKRRALDMGSDWALPGEDIVFEDETDFDSWDRCITRGMPSSMMPYRYNGGFSIRQAPGVVIFDLEMIHESRVIPTDGRPPLNSAIKQWMGESRGHWEGDTLVVETTNYKEGPPMINLAVVGSPPGNRFPISDQMKTTERITRLSDDTWLYEITTEDPVILTRPFTVRYPMRNDPEYWWPEYACHEDNTIVPNYVQTNRHERANPPPEPVQAPIEVTAEVADALVGRWVGRPDIATIDVDIEIEFTRNANGTLQAKLIGTNLGEIDKPLRSATSFDGTTAPIVDGRVIRFELPNIQPWTVGGDLTADGAIVGFVSSIQGGAPVTFRRVSPGTQ